MTTDPTKIFDELHDTIVEAKCHAASVLRSALAEIADEASRTLPGGVDTLVGGTFSFRFVVGGKDDAPEDEETLAVWSNLVHRANELATQAERVGLVLGWMEIPADEHSLIAEGREAGAKIGRVAGTVRWIVLDQPEDSPLHSAFHDGEREATEAFLAEHRPSNPPSI